MHIKKVWTVFVDGASRGNPGDAGAGIHVEEDGIAVLKKGFYLGKKTNNQAEYLALALALYTISEHHDGKSPLPSLHIFSDSELLVRQIKNIYKVRNPELIHLKAVVNNLLSSFYYNIRHIDRALNSKADALANKGIDTKTKVPARFLTLLHQQTEE